MSKTLDPGAPVCSAVTKIGLRKDSGEPVTRSWVQKAHRCAWEVMASLCCPIPQFAENVNAGSGKKVSEHADHLCLLHIGLCSHRPVGVLMLTRQKLKAHTVSDHVGIRTGPWSNGWRWPVLMLFFYIIWRSRCLYVMAPGCTMGRMQASGGSVVHWAVLLGDIYSCEFLWHLPPTKLLLQTHKTVFRNGSGLLLTGQRVLSHCKNV